MVHAFFIIRYTPFDMHKKVLQNKRTDFHTRKYFTYNSNTTSYDSGQLSMGDNLVFWFFKSNLTCIEFHADLKLIRNHECHTRTILLLIQTR